MELDFLNLRHRRSALLGLERIRKSYRKGLFNFCEEISYSFSEAAGVIIRKHTTVDLKLDVLITRKVQIADVKAIYLRAHIALSCKHSTPDRY